MLATLCEPEATPEPGATEVGDSCGDSVVFETEPLSTDADSTDDEGAFVCEALGSDGASSDTMLPREVGALEAVTFVVVLLGAVTVVVVDVTFVAAVDDVLFC